MGFLSILSAVGKGALTLTGLLQSPIVRGAEAYAPASVQPALGKMNAIIAEIAMAQNIATTIEAQLGSVSTGTGGGTGLDLGLAKAQAVLPSVKDILRQAEFMSGRNIADEELFTAGCKKILDGFVDVLHSVAHGDGSASGKTAPQPAALKSIG